MNWKVKFMRRGFEPPMPFGKTIMVIPASSRLEAIDKLKRSDIVSPFYPKITASKTDQEASYHFR